MKKTFFFLIVLMVFSMICSGQVTTNYVFSQTEGSWEPISGGTIIWSGTFNNNPAAEITIPTFTFDGNNYTTVYVSENGYITFGASPANNNYTPISSSEGYSGIVSAFGANLGHSTAGSPEVSYILSENEVIIQWKDVRRYLVGGEVISFQIRLNLNDGTIRVIYGGMIASGQNGVFPQVGLRGPSNTFGVHVNNRMIAADGGSWINSLLGISNSSTMYFRNANPGTTPFEGLEFKWTPGNFIPCFSPTALNTSNITVQSANLSWVAPFPLPPMGYEWEVRSYGEPGSGADGLAANGIVEAGITQAQVYGLTPANEYTAYVRSHCGDDNYSPWSVGYIFLTECEPLLELPYQQGFETVLFPPPCWKTIQVNGNGLWNGVAAGTHPVVTPFEGSRMAYFNCYNYVAGTSALLVSPAIELENALVKVKFWMYRDNGYDTYADRVIILHNNNPVVAGSQALDTIHRYTGMSPEVSQNGWYQYEYIVPQVEDMPDYVLIQAIGEYGNNIFIDNLSFVYQQLPSIDLSPLNYDFGVVSTIAPTAPFDFIIDNTGFGAVQIDSVQFVSDNSLDFEYTDVLSYPYLLEQDSAVKVQLAFTPKSEGLKTAVIRVYSELGVFAANITGTGFIEDVYQLPFVENWNYESFDTNNWVFNTPVSNWQMRNTSGNPAPAARFHWGPVQLNYLFSMTGPAVYVGNTGNIVCSFDLRFGDYATTNTEFLKIYLLNGNEWLELIGLTNAGDLPWSNYSFSFPALTGDYTKIRFEVSGINSENINFWEMDNIFINGQPMNAFEMSPDNINYGQVMTGTSSVPVVFTMTNPGINPVAVTGLNLDGDDLLQFVLYDENTYPLTINNGEVKTVNVIYAPQSAGTHQVSLKAVTGLGEYQSILEGTGFDEYIGQVPFAEDWSSGNFDTRMWLREPVEENWHVQLNSGNPAPTARFSFSPIGINYSRSLISPKINIPLSNQSLLLSFDVKLNNYVTSGTEWLKVYLKSEDNWVVVDSFSNAAAIDWTARLYDVSDKASIQTRIRFEATGQNTGNISNWEIDNVLLVFDDLPQIIVNPTEIFQEVPNSGTSSAIMTIENSGTADLFFEVSVEYLDYSPAYSWLTINSSTGTVLPGASLPIELIFNGEGLNLGETYEANIRIASNDLQNAVLIVPVTLSVLLKADEIPHLGITIYPVPAKDQIVIKGIEGFFDVQICHQNGSVASELKRLFGKEVSISTTSLPAGIYIMQCLTAETVLNFKLIIH